MTSMWRPPVARPLLNSVSTQSRVRDVGTFGDLLQAVSEATYRGTIPFEGISRNQDVGTTIRIVSPITFKSEVEIPTRCYGLTIEATARFNNLVVHTGPIFRLRSVLTTIRGINVVTKADATEEPSHFVYLDEADAEFGGGGAAYTRVEKCLAYAERFVESGSGLDCASTSIDANDHFTITGATANAVTVVGDGCLVTNNRFGDPSVITFGASNDGRLAIGNYVDIASGGSVVNADVDVNW